jgi:hypothetical protein
MATVVLRLSGTSAAPTTVDRVARKSGGPAGPQDAVLTTADLCGLRDAADLSASAFDSEATIVFGTWYTNMGQALKDATYNTFKELPD